MLLISGCGEKLEDKKPPKEKAQDALLYELRHCHGKFSSSALNSEYCDKILDTVNNLIIGGYFDITIPNEFNNTKINNITTETQESYKILNNIEKDIIGDI